MTYIARSNCKDKIIISTIENGFIVEYRELITTKQIFFSTLSELQEWISKFYIKIK